MSEASADSIDLILSSEEELQLQNQNLWKNVTLNDLQKACDAGNTSSVCDMLHSAPHLVRQLVTRTLIRRVINRT